MVIRQVNRNTFDVFTSEQYWDGWTRVRFGKDGLFGVAGNRLTRAAMKEVEAAINSR